MLYLSFKSKRGHFWGQAHCIRRMSLCLSIFFLLVSCAVPIAYYDVATYTHLTELKVEMSALVESFDTKPATENEKTIGETILRFRKAYEYENGKGNLNSDTMNQFKKIEQLFNEDVAQYRERGPGALGAKFFQEAARVLGQAFDIAIATENEKNKDKR